MVAFFTEPHLLEGAIEAEDLACQQNGDAEGVGFLHDEADVLLLQVDGEAGPPVAFDDLGPAIGEHPAAGGAAGDGVEAFLEIDAAGLGKDEGFAYGEAVADDKNLVDEL